MTVMGSPPESRMTAGAVGLDAFLCDSVEGVGSKLFALGIGWNKIYTAQLPTRQPRIGVGLLFYVPYTATNQAHNFSVHIEDEDGQLLPLGDVAPGVDEAFIEGDKVVRL